MLLRLLYAGVGMPNQKILKTKNEMKGGKWKKNI